MRISRRDFIQSVSTAALVAGSSAIALPVEALTQGASTGPTGKVQVGVSSDTAMFKNFLSNMGSYHVADPSQLNIDQYPNAAPLTTTTYGTFQMPANVTPATTLVLAWTGVATRGGAGAFGLVSSAMTVTLDKGNVVRGGKTRVTSLTVEGANGYIEFKFDSTTGAYVAFNFYGGATFLGMSSVICCRKSDYDSIVNATEAGQLLTDDFVNALKTLNPKTVRCLGLNAVNDNNVVTQHKYRLNWKTALSYANSRWIPNCWVGTISGTGSFTCSAAKDTPAVYTMGEVIQGKFLNNGSGALTIDVGGRGAVPLYRLNGTPLTFVSGGPTAFHTLIYDDILGAYLVKQFGGYGGDLFNAPVEVEVALANRIGCNLWHQFPAHVTTQNTTMEPVNSVSQITSLIASTLTNGCYFEYLNEVWNVAGSIGTNTIWAGFSGAAFGFPNTIGAAEHIFAYYAYKLATIMPLVRTAWGGKSGLKCVIGVQAFGDSGGINKATLKGIDLAPSGSHTGTGNALWSSYTRSADYTQFPNRPIDVCDTIAYATYYSGTQCTNFDANYVAISGAKNISGISQANPGVLTFGLDPGYATGNRIKLSGIKGMTQLNNTNVSLTKLTATTYSIYSDAALSTPVDTTGFTAYTSGGTSGRYSGISGLTAWVDLYSTGNVSNIASALASLDGDIRNAAFGQTLNSLRKSVYPAWEAIARLYDGARPTGRANLTIECYEGGLECSAPSTASCTTLGISTSYGGPNGSISKLLTAYKNSTTFKATVQQQFNDFFAARMANSRVQSACWFLMNGSTQWSMYPRDIYSTPYQSYAAVRDY
jgi:hypothetical protein